jgi:membrane protein insertase Oxa1/YidC/SpoIIIJ
MADSLFNSFAPDLNSLRAVPADVWQKVFATFSPEYLAQVAANIPNYVDGMIDFSNSTALTATIQTLSSAMELQPAYQQAIAVVPGWANINFFLFSVTLYQNFNGLLILPVLAGASQWLMTILTPQPEAAPAQNGKPAQGQGMNSFMKYFFPLLSVYFCLVSNAGFALYWVTSNVIAGLQSVLITRHYDRKDRLAAQAAGEGEVK